MISSAWRRSVTTMGFEPLGAALTLGVVFAERAVRWIPVEEIREGALRAAFGYAETARACPRSMRRMTMLAFAKTCVLATCAHYNDYHAVYNAGSLFAKMVETEKRVRASVTRDASAAATAAFALVLGGLANATAVVSANYLFPDLASQCFQGSSGLLFALKTYRARADFAAGVRGRVSFFGFIDVPAEMASLAEIAILYMLDSSPAMLNVYASGAVVGLALASFESSAMNALARATRGVQSLLSLAPGGRIGARVVLTGMRNGSLNGQWGTVTANVGGQVTVRLDSDRREVTALPNNLIFP